MKHICNLCGWFEIDSDDPLATTRKKRHEEFHSPTKIKRNTKIGVVSWIQS